MEDQRRQQETAELEDLLSTQKIAEITALIRQNIALAQILERLGLDKTTQALPKAKQLGEAFHGQITKVPPETVEQTVNEAFEKCGEIIEENRITREVLSSIIELLWVYARYDHPITKLLEMIISKIEGTEDTKVFTTGLAAIEAIVKQFTPTMKIVVEKDGERRETDFLEYDRTLEKDNWEIKEYIRGGKVVVIGNVYGGTHAQGEDLIRETGRRVERMTIAQFHEKGIPHDADMVYFETSENPTLEISPVKKILAKVKELEEKQNRKIYTVADNTFTPLTVAPKALGVDFVINSCTKYFNGKSEDPGGAVSGEEKLLAQLKDTKRGKRMVEGASMGIHTAKNHLKNIEGLPERLLFQTKNMRALQRIATELYLGFTCIELKEPGFADAYAEIRDPKMPQSISNGMITIDFGSLERAEEFTDRMIEEGAAKGAVSLGAADDDISLASGPNTYISIPAMTTHSEMTDAQLEKAGVTKGMVRISCGTDQSLPAKFKKVVESLKKT